MAAPIPGGVTASPLRADAERNRLRILEAAAQVFAERGLDGTLHDVAKPPGWESARSTGAFRTREALIEALFETEMERIADLAEQASRQPDAWAALIGFLRGMCGEQAENRGLHEVLNSSDYGQDRVAAGRGRIMPIIAEMLSAGSQEQGSARKDIEPSDLGMLDHDGELARQFVLEARSDAWVRYFELIIDALGTAPGQTAFSVPALSDAEMASAMTKLKHEH